MFSSFYVGASGMKAQAEGMSVISNNIANVNTVGFKNSNFTFQNLMSQNLGYGIGATGHESGYSQLGMGVSLAEVEVDFAQGAFAMTNQITNLGIGGKGFFKVTNNGQEYYTRAGNFQFDKNGYIVDPSGAQLQGASIVNGIRSSTTQSIQLKPDATGKMTIPAKATSLATVLTNLSGGTYTNNAANPFFGLTKAWNGTSSNAPLSTEQYAYSTSIKVYDQNGEAHNLTVYYDQVNTSNAGGKKIWQYVVAMPAGEDTRAGFKGTSNAGLLMTGTLSFNSAGILESQSAFSPTGSGDPKSLKNWGPASFTAEGYPQINTSFSNGGNVSMGLNMGLANTGSGWSTTVSNASAIGTDPSKLPSFSAQAAAGKTTSACCAVAVMKMSCTTRKSRLLSAECTFLLQGSEYAGSSPTIYIALISPVAIICVAVRPGPRGRLSAPQAEEKYLMVFGSSAFL
jgi:flagellar hook protein FlgE